MQIAAGFLFDAKAAHLWLARSVDYCFLPGICDTSLMPITSTQLNPLSDEMETWLQTQVESYLGQLRELEPDTQDQRLPHDLLRRVFLASEFAREEARRRPQEFAALLRGPESMPQWQDCADETSDMFSMRLRRFRRLGSVALIVRDLAGMDTVTDTLTGASGIAETCIEAAVAHVEAQLQTRFGVPRSATGETQRLVVIAMGKLGGGELNFSSDVDLILAFPEAGESDGTRSLDNEEYFTRLGQRLAQMLGDVTHEGFVLRVDYRLRPYGSAGRVALSFNAMEQYYQREGREWERYAWIKARPVAGDIGAGRKLIEMLRPFVYRRYLDFTAIEGLRDLKGRIDLEVDRQDLADNLKLGPGGIRELEFAVQLAQLIRGGREASLRVSGFMQALAALEANGQFDAEIAQRTRELYLFLRHIENHAQMFADEQTHALPGDPTDAARVALALGFSDLAALQARIDAVRSEVQALFARTLDAPERGRRLRAGETPEAPPTLDLPEFSVEVQEAVTQLLGSLQVRRLDTRARERFERALPLLMLATRKTASPDVAALRLLRLLQAIAGRPSYLALLAERRAARERVAAVFARSAFLAERVIAHPLLLDDLLDGRVEADVIQDEDIDRLFVHSLARVAEGDVEAELAALHEARQSAVFRTALAWSNRRLSAQATAAILASIAERCVRRVLSLARRDLELQHGNFPDALLILAYGSFGGSELGFGSDLDLVFLFDPEVAALVSTGARALEGGRYVARLSQRVLHWLSTPTHAGPLYEVDVRLRPDGAKGLLVSPLNAFLEYQLQRAWVWEHQALVRARVVAGPMALSEAFAKVRREVLQQGRTAEEVSHQVGRMRARWRRELDRSDARRFDLKQGRGGLVDIEFLLQGLVLMHAAEYPAIVSAATTPELIDALVHCGLVELKDGQLLAQAHAVWLERALDCALDVSPRVIARDDQVASLADAVTHIIHRAGFGDRESAAG
jgi:[glutamine synthetase] adenylyltransferase / [glutamine synthetase]-adenylyl-L-tyrosine phosphorylase